MFFVVLTHSLIRALLKADVMKNQRVPSQPLDDMHIVAFLQQENSRLEEEVKYYRSILFSEINPATASILNALRHAADVATENAQLRTGAEFRRLEVLCRVLDDENVALRLEIDRISKQDPRSLLNQKII